MERKQFLLELENRVRGAVGFELRLDRSVVREASRFASSPD
jgi:hypothetical protein